MQFSIQVVIQKIVLTVLLYHWTNRAITSPWVIIEVYLYYVTQLFVEIIYICSKRSYGKVL